jgi:1-acyl-sn-glycerol-3-phosphate acyltransferase
VPVALDGAYRIWPRKSWRFRLAKVKIRFGEPIDVHSVVSGETNRELSYEKVTAELKQRIQQMLDEMRGRNSGDHAILLR